MPPIEIDGEAEYKVSGIMGHKELLKQSFDSPLASLGWSQSRILAFFAFGESDLAVYRSVYHYIVATAS